jgi:hypothetical protein
MPKNKKKLWYINQCFELEKQIVLMEKIGVDIRLRMELQEVKELLAESLYRETILNSVIHSLRDNSKLPPSKMLRYRNGRLRPSVNS